MEREFRAVIALAVVMSVFYVVLAIHEKRNKHLPEYKEFTERRFARFATRYRSWRYFTDVFLKSPNKPRDEAKSDNDSTTNDASKRNY